MEPGPRERVVDRVGLSGLLALPLVAAVVYVATGDAFTALVGPTAVGAVIGAMALAESADVDVRYVKGALYVLGVAGGAVMSVSPQIPGWFGVGLAVASAWLLVDTLVDLYEGNPAGIALPHSIEDELHADVAVAVVTELDGGETVTPEGVAERLDVGVSRVESVLADLRERGLVTRTEDGYRLDPEYGSLSHTVRRLANRLTRPLRIIRYVS